MDIDYDQVQTLCVNQPYAGTLTQVFYKGLFVGTFVEIVRSACPTSSYYHTSKCTYTNSTTEIFYTEKEAIAYLIGGSNESTS